ncbi:MAG TPA: 30S ribosomal protein S16 [Verrucomicrobiae bacterium]|nr:30S ribosomal protein S16 [Verrucomicrobiae bacterium]
MVRIRLKKFGTKNVDQWRIVVSDIKMPRDGRFIEEIGYYNPLRKEELIVIKKERLDYWVSKGAQISITVKSLIKRFERKARKTAKK